MIDLGLLSLDFFLHKILYLFFHIFVPSCVYREKFNIFYYYQDTTTAENVEPKENGHVKNVVEEERIEEIIEPALEKESTRSKTATPNGLLKDKGHVEVKLLPLIYLLRF